MNAHARNITNTNAHKQTNAHAHPLTHWHAHTLQLIGRQVSGEEEKVPVQHIQYRQNMQFPPVKSVLN